MTREPPYYVSIYTHIIRQVYLGQLCRGDTLGTVQSLCERYAVGKNTVRTALQLLQKEGFIQISRGRPPVVVYDGKGNTVQQGNLCGERKHLEEIYRMMTLVMPPLLSFGARHCSTEDCRRLRAVLDEMEPIPEKAGAFRDMESRYFDLILSKTQNPGAIWLFHAAEESLMTASLIACSAREEMLLVRKGYAQRLERITDLIEGGDPARFHNEAFTFCEWVEESVGKLLREHAPGADCVPVQSSVSGVGVCLYQNVISVVIDGLLAGDYGEGDFLPSERDMKESCRVAVNTVRTAYRTLNGMCITETVNGSGTKIALLAGMREPLDFRDRKSLEGICGYLEALQLTAIVAEDVALYAADRMTEEAALQMERAMDSAFARGRETSAFILMNGVMEAAGNHVLWEIWSRIKRNLVWGVRLRASCGASSHIRNEEKKMHGQCRKALESWRSGHRRDFALALAKSFFRAYEISRMTVEDCGILPPGNGQAF